jgi:predicted ABC-type ATPase
MRFKNLALLVLTSYISLPRTLLASTLPEKFNTDKVKTARKAASLIPVAHLKEEEEKLIQHFYGTGAIKKEGQASVVIGLPGSGKSFFIRLKGSEFSEALILDADTIKEALPNYQNGLGAAAVHEISTKIAYKIFYKAIENRDNLVWSTSGSSLYWTQFAIQKLHEHHYTVHLIYIDVEPQTAIQRALNRFYETGRWVDPEIIWQMAGEGERKRNKAEITYQVLKSEVDSYEKYDNNTEEYPTLMEASTTKALCEPAKNGIASEEEQHPPPLQCYNLRSSAKSKIYLGFSFENR